VTDLFIRDALAAITRRITKKILCIGDDEDSTSPKYDANEAKPKTINTNARQSEKTNEPGPGGSSFRTERMTRRMSSKSITKSKMIRSVPMYRKLLHSANQTQATSVAVTLPSQGLESRSPNA